MRYKMFRVAIFLIFACSQVHAQQLSERSTYDANSFIWNPAMTGIYDYWELGATYKQQWVGFDDAPRTIMASFQYPFAEKNMGLGLYVMHDKTHPLLFNSIGFTYNYHFKLNITRDDYFSIGLLGTYGEYRLDVNNIITSTSRDPLMPIDGTSKIIPNAGAGFFYTTNKDKYDTNTFYLGMGVQQLFNSALKFDGTDQDINFMQTPHANAMLGASILINNYTYIEPSAWVNYASQNIFEVNLGVRIEQEDTFWAGANFNVSQNFSVQGGVILTNSIFEDGQLRIGGMATYNVGVLGSSLGLGYEFYLGYRFYQ